MMSLFLQDIIHSRHVFLDIKIDSYFEYATVLKQKQPG